MKRTIFSLIAASYALSAVGCVVHERPARRTTVVEERQVEVVHDHDHDHGHHHDHDHDHDHDRD